MLSQAMLVGSGLIMLPFVLTSLTAAQVGIWYIFLTVQGMVFLLDFGANQTFVRFFGYIFGGARDLTDGQVPEEASDCSVNVPLLAALLRTSRRVYLGMTLLVGALLLSVGSYGVHVLARNVTLPESVWPAWIIFVVTMMAQTFFQWQAPPLIGSGGVRRNYEIAVLSRGVQVVLSIVALTVSPSLLAMSLSFAASAIVMRLAYHLSLRPVRELVRGAVWSKRDYPDLIRVVFRSARQLGAMVAGVQLTSRFVVLAVAWYAGVIISAQFSIAYQALVALNAVAFVAQTTFQPRAARARVSGDKDTLCSLFSLSLAFGWCVYLVGGLGLLYVLPFLLEQIGSSTPLPPTSIVLLMVVNSAIEMNMFSATHMITTAANTVPYWRAMIVSGVLTMLAVVAAGELEMGLPGILLAQFLIQLCYNYWRWPVYCFALLGLRPTDTYFYVLAGIRKATLR